jgi:hypothetical protein
MMFRYIAKTLLLVTISRLVFALRAPQTRLVYRDLVTLEGCAEKKDFATAYNENNNGYLYSGMYAHNCFIGYLNAICFYFSQLIFVLYRMFTVRTKSKPITITTLEFDMRSDLANSDLAVEVYTLRNGYTAAYNVESLWTLVTSTSVVPVPGDTKGSVLIPVQDFNKILLSANELRSFYITMRNPCIESTSNALIDSGELSSENDVLRIDVGSGLATYKFPSTFDTTTAPQFAGIIHYEEDTAEACATPEALTKLSIEYKFLVNASGLDPMIVGIVNNETKNFFDEQISNDDGFLKEYKISDQLTQLTDPTSVASDRPIGKLFLLRCGD